MGVLGYQSLVGPHEDTIKIEIAMREPLYLPTAAVPAETLLLDPNSRGRLVAPVEVHCISKTEAFAEKFRAALSRREAAIRDFFDLDYAVRRLSIQPEDVELIGLVRQKLAVPGNSPVDVSPARLASLRQQLAPQLKAVLRAADFAEFDLDRAFQIVATMADKVA